MFPNQRLNSSLLHWEHGVLTTGPPGKPIICLKKMYKWPIDTGKLAHVISYQGDSNQIHLKYFLILAMVTIVQKNEKQEMLVDTEKSEPCHCWWERRMVQLLWRTVWQFSVFQKLHTESPDNPALPLLDTYLRDLKTYVTQGRTHGCS